MNATPRPPGPRADRDAAAMGLRDVANQAQPESAARHALRSRRGAAIEGLEQSCSASATRHSGTPVLHHELQLARRLRPSRPCARAPPTRLSLPVLQRIVDEVPDARCAAPRHRRRRVRVPTARPPRRGSRGRTSASTSPTRCAGSTSSRRTLRPPGQHARQLRASARPARCSRSPSRSHHRPVASHLLGVADDAVGEVLSRRSGSRQAACAARARPRPRTVICCRARARRAMARHREECRAPAEQGEDAETDGEVPPACLRHRRAQ